MIIKYFFFLKNNDVSTHYPRAYKKLCISSLKYVQKKKQNRVKVLNACCNSMLYLWRLSRLITYFFQYNLRYLRRNISGRKYYNIAYFT